VSDKPNIALVETHHGEWREVDTNGCAYRGDLRLPWGEVRLWKDKLGNWFVHDRFWERGYYLSNSQVLGLYQVAGKPFSYALGIECGLPIPEGGTATCPPPSKPIGDGPPLKVDCGNAQIDVKVTKEPSPVEKPLKKRR
jgi:hypothetical protein